MQKINGNNNTRLRTDEMWEKYLKADRSGPCFFCADVDAQDAGEYWRVRPNDYPYDAVASRHDLLYPKRHVTQDGLTDEELAECKQIIGDMVGDDTYDSVIENLPKAQTVPGHYHLHLIKWKTKK